jgi:Ca2+-binding RTX toxin-like protein
VESFEQRQMLSAISAAIDGTGNNVENPDWGSTDVELLRLAGEEYSDGVSSPSGDDRVSAREVSNAIASQEESVLNDRNLTDFVWIWGQFIDHDIDLTEGADPEEEFNIQVPTGDAYFDPFATGSVEIGLNRSVYVDGEESSNGLRQQINQITAFLDGSVVYGSDQERADALRTFSGGLLKTSDGDLLPFNEDGLANAGGPSSSLFLAGDIRANENVALLSMHTVFVREHNRIATELAAENPDLTDEELYQQARAQVQAQLQAITYNEYLPALLGVDALSAYTGYDATVNPNIANEFSTAAYRFGHSLLSPELVRLDADGNVIEEGNLSLAQAFFNPGELVEQGIDSILRGAGTQLAQELDSQIIDEVRNFLFGPPGAGGLDLASLNIQRGRDHGLADYNQTRVDLGLEAVTSFDQITSDPELALTLEQTYGSVDNIDLWVGGLAEDHVTGSSMGETFRTIIADQFERLRDGDRFWYQNVFSGDELAAIESTRLSDIIERNTDVTGLQTNVFFQRGTEVLQVNLQDAQADRVTVRQRDGIIEVINDRDRSVMDSRPVEELAGLVIRGADGVEERVVIDSRMTTDALPQGIQVSGGRMSQDTLVIAGTPNADVIRMSGDRIDVNDLDVFYQSMHTVMLDGHQGDDVLDASGSSAALTILNGGAGNDTLTGSDRDDRMFGGAGDDILLGRDGDDLMFGGEGNDRMYGHRGRDQMSGGAGTDMMIENGSGQSPQDMQRLAAFLDDTLDLRSNGNLFENWGGLGEKWIYGNGGWHFITPDGTLYLWDGSANAAGTEVAQLNTTIFDSPELLFDSPVANNDDDSPQAMRATTDSIRNSLNLRSNGNLFENWGGLGERWIYGDQGWYFVLPDGRLFQWDGMRDLSTSLPVAELTADFFNNLNSNRPRRGR